MTFNESLILGAIVGIAFYAAACISDIQGERSKACRDSGGQLVKNADLQWICMKGEVIK